MTEFKSMYVQDSNLVLAELQKTLDSIDSESLEKKERKAVRYLQRLENSA